MTDQERINIELRILTFITKVTIKYPRIGGVLLRVVYGKNKDS